MGTRRKITTASTQKPPARAKPSKQPLDPSFAATAVLNLCDLVIRVLTVDQRGQTSLADGDETLFKSIAENLVRRRNAQAVGKASRKTPKLTQDMQSVGWLRMAFDDLCRFAAEQPATRERDRELAGHLYIACLRFGGGLGMRRHHVDAAVLVTMRAAKRNARSRRVLEAGENLPIDWLRNTERRDDRFSPAIAAGNLLHAVLRRADRPIDAKTSGSSTADYAKRTLAQLKAQTARRVDPRARLTFLMTVLGATEDSAPLIAYQLSHLLSGGALLNRSPSLQEGLSSPWEPKPPAAFRLYEAARKEDLLLLARRAFVALGMVDSEDLERATRSALDAFLPEATPWAGSNIEQITTRPLAVDNPWALSPDARKKHPDVSQARIPRKER